MRAAVDAELSSEGLEAVGVGLIVEARRGGGELRRAGDDEVRLREPAGGERADRVVLALPGRQLPDDPCDRCIGGEPERGAGFRALMAGG